MREACEREPRREQRREGWASGATARLLLTSLFDQRAWKQEQIQLHPRIQYCSARPLRGEGSASGKHPINKGRFYTRPSLPREEDGASERASARARAASTHARTGVCRGLKIRERGNGGESGRREERRARHGTGGGTKRRRGKGRTERTSGRIDSDDGR